MKIQLIRSPSPGVLAILIRRGLSECQGEVPGAVGLVQGQLADILTAADLAEKAAAVKIGGIRGVCPQHITLIAIYGETAAVECALKAIDRDFPST